jgi:serine/threonine protein kinase
MSGSAVPAASTPTRVRRRRRPSGEPPPLPRQRVTVKGDPETYLFAKLYSATHLRSDRWYKLGRELLYGRLEDEKSFHSVRRLVQQEDHLLRLLRDAGLPVPSPYGVVEITPEREYLLVTEFLDGAREIGEVEVDDDLIDQGLGIVRRLWEAGLAHRDIKPANLMVREQGRDLHGEFVALLPEPPHRGDRLGHEDHPLVDLVASAVPCVRSALDDWFLDDMDSSDGHTRIECSRLIDEFALTIELTRTCERGGAGETATDQPGTRRFDARDRTGESYRDRRYYLLPGACVTYRFALTGTGAEQAAEDISRAIGFVSRPQLADQVRSYSGGRLQLDPAAS